MILPEHLTRVMYYNDIVRGAMVMCVTVSKLGPNNLGQTLNLFQSTKLQCIELSTSVGG